MIQQQDLDGLFSKSLHADLNYFFFSRVEEEKGSTVEVNNEPICEFLGASEPKSSSLMA